MAEVDRHVGRVALSALDTEQTERASVLCARSTVNAESALIRTAWEAMFASAALISCRSRKPEIHVPQGAITYPIR